MATESDADIDQFLSSLPSSTSLSSHLKTTGTTPRGEQVKSRLSLLKSKIRKSESSSSSRQQTVSSNDEFDKGSGRLTAPSVLDYKSTLPSRQDSLSDYVPTFKAVARDRNRGGQAENVATLPRKAAVDKRTSSQQQKEQQFSERDDDNDYEEDDIRMGGQRVGGGDTDDMMDLLECPHCQRKFSEKPYQKHVSICLKVPLYILLEITTY